MMRQVGLYAYMAGIAGSMESVANTLMMAKQMDMERERMTWDYAINKAKLTSDLAVREKEQRRADIQMNMRSKEHEQQMSLYEQQLQEAKNRNALFDPEHEKRMRQLEEDLTNASLTTKQAESELFDMQKKQVQNELYKQDLNNRLTEIIGRAQQELQKKYNDAASKIIEYDIRSEVPTSTKVGMALAAVGTELKKPKSIIGTILSGSSPQEIAMGIAANITGEYAANVSMEGVKPTKQSTIEAQGKKAYKEHQDYILYQDVLRRRNAMLAEIDKAIKESNVSNVNKFQIMDQLSQQFPGMIPNPTLNVPEGDGFKYAIPGITMSPNEKTNALNIYNYLDLGK